MRRFRACFVLLLALSVVGAQAQDLGIRPMWSADFATRFDNREYRSEFSGSKTLFAYRFIPEVGLSFGGGHSLFAGIAPVHNMGAHIKSQSDLGLMMWYHYDGEKFSALAGDFPRKYMTDYPREFFSGTNTFYDPALEGLLLKYRGTCWDIEAAGDWYSMKSDTRREQFILYSSGVWRPLSAMGRFMVGYHATVQHFSESEIDQGVVDNLLVKPYAAFDRGSWSLSAAWVQALQRDRINDDRWVLPNGVLAGVKVHWRSMGMQNDIYLGDDLMPYWSRYGGELYKGDPFFRTTHGVYNRFEVYWRPRLKSRMVSLQIGSVHHYDGATWNWQQTATLKININNQMVKNK